MRSVVVIALAALSLSAAATAGAADQVIRRRAPTGIGVTCRSPGVARRTRALFDRVDEAARSPDMEAAMAALGPAEAAGADWLALVCAAHRVAARENLRLRASSPDVAMARTPEARAVAQARVDATVAARDRAEAWLAAHAAFRVSTRRPEGEASLSQRPPVSEDSPCPRGCVLDATATSSAGDVPAEAMCVCIGGHVFEPRPTGRKK